MILEEDLGGNGESSLAMLGTTPPYGDFVP